MTGLCLSQDFYIETTALFVCCKLESLRNIFQRNYTEIPWKDVKALRNRIAHDYMHTDFDIFWVTLTEDIPILEVFCSKIIKASEVIYANALKTREIEDDDSLKNDR